MKILFQRPHTLESQIEWGWKIPESPVNRGNGWKKRDAWKSSLITNTHGLDLQVVSTVIKLKNLISHVA